AGTEAGIYKTSSGFGSWSQSNNGLRATEVFAFAFDPTSSGTLYASSFGAGVFKSTDNGSSWTLLNEPLIYTLPVKVDSTGQVFTGGDGGLRMSTDHGATWTTPPMPQSGRVWGLDVSSSTYYAATSAGVRRSTDAGASWNAQTSGTGGVIFLSVAADPTNSAV